MSFFILIFFITKYFIELILKFNDSEFESQYFYVQKNIHFFYILFLRFPIKINFNLKVVMLQYVK